MPRSDETPRDLHITRADREKLDKVIDEEGAKIPDKPKPVSKLYEQVRAQAEADGLAAPEALGLPAGLPGDDQLAAASPAAPAPAPATAPNDEGGKRRIVVGPTPTMPVAEITIGTDRREISEERVVAIVESIREIGLMQPIVVTPAGRLVAGGHRLEAYKRLEWPDIPVVIKPYDTIRGELAMLDENLVRNELIALERDEAIARRKVLYEQLHPEARQGGAPGKAGGGKVARPVGVASFADDTAKKTGRSARTVARDVQVVKGISKEVRDRIRRSELAKNQAELLKLARIKNQEEQRLIAVMVMDGKAKNIDDAMRRRRLALRHEEIAKKNREQAQLEAGEGAITYPVISADCPWVYYRVISKSREIDNQYDQMTTEDLADLPVGDVAAQDCVLFMWATAPHLKEAFYVAEHWGFEYRSNLVWDKIDPGMGIWAQIEHEHLLIFVKGKPPAPEAGKKPRSVIHAKAGEHSKKPEEAYLLIEKAYPTFAKLELFARERRPGWKTIGNEIDGSDISVAIADIIKRAGVKMEAEVPRADGLPSASELGPDSATAPATPPVTQPPAESAP